MIKTHPNLDLSFIACHPDLKLFDNIRFDILIYIHLQQLKKGEMLTFA